MAGAFNLFSDISERDKGCVAKPFLKSKSTLEPTFNPLKSSGVVRPKGLSMRSKSELNIPAILNNNNIKRNTHVSNTPELLKAKPVQSDFKSGFISPGKQSTTKRKEVIESKKPKLQKSSNEYCFKKPLPPKKRSKTQEFLSPEKLSNFYDYESELENVCNINIQDELRDLLPQRQKLSNVCEDEGFESDPEPCVSTIIPSLATSLYYLDSMSLEDDVPDLPPLSDDEIFS